MSLFPAIDQELTADTQKELDATAHAAGVEVAILHGLFHYMKKRFDTLDQKLDALAAGPGPDSTHLEITSGKPKDKDT